MVNQYLVAAFSAVWVIFMLYAWSLSRRQGELKRELEDLRAMQGGKPGPGGAALT